MTDSLPGLTRVGTQVELATSAARTLALQAPLHMVCALLVVSTSLVYTCLESSDGFVVLHCAEMRRKR